jgi:hypothetical protein
MLAQWTPKRCLQEGYDIEDALAIHPASRNKVFSQRIHNLAESITNNVSMEKRNTQTMPPLPT